MRPEPHACDTVPAMTLAATERPALRASFVLVGIVFVALAGVAVLVGRQIWTSYSPAMPKTLFHVPNDSTYAARIDLPNPALETAVRPLLDVLNGSHPGLGTRQARFEARTGVKLRQAIRELAVAQGPDADDWVITASGELPSANLLEAISEILKEEGRLWQLDAAQGRLVGPSGMALGLATDGTLILASDLRRLERAQKRDTGEPARSVARGVFPEEDEVAERSRDLAKRVQTRSITP